MLGQTVPSTSSSNGVRFAHWQWTSDSQRQRSGVEVSPVLEIITGAHSSSARYDTNFKYTRTACLLYWILSWVSASTDYRCWKNGVMWSYLDEENTSRAAEFIADCSCWSSVISCDVYVNYNNKLKICGNNRVCYNSNATVSTYSEFSLFLDNFQAMISITISTERLWRFLSSTTNVRFRNTSDKV